MMWPDKRYKVIYADPPWPMKFVPRKVRPKQLDMPYRVMTIEDIKGLPVNGIANQDGCHLFLWATHKYLPIAFDVMASWGFKYNCCLTWDKGYGFTPFSFMWSTEFLLYGQLPNRWVRPIGVGRHKTMINHKPMGHSVKPDIVRDMIVNFIGDVPRVELFARKKVDGWDAWGDEV